MLSGNTTTSNDRNVESGWVAVAVPMNVPCLMSAIDDLTTAIARNLSANIIAIRAVLRVYYEFGTFDAHDCASHAHRFPIRVSGPTAHRDRNQNRSNSGRKTPEPILRPSHPFLPCLRVASAWSEGRANPRRLLGPARTRVGRYPHRAQRASIDITKIAGGTRVSLPLLGRSDKLMLARRAAVPRK